MLQMGDLENKRELVIECKFDSLDQINPWLESICVDYKIPDTRRFDISVCLYEAVANVIMYAFEQPLGQMISINISLNTRSIEISVEDEGRLFNPMDHPEPILPSSISEAAVGGHGISLIRNLSDRIQYSRSGQRNKLVM